MLKILKTHYHLKPFENDLNLRMNLYKEAKKKLLKPRQSLVDFANGHKFYGFHHVKGNWIYREWAPAADAMFLTGDFNSWHWLDHPLTRIDAENWEISISDKILHEGSKVKVIVSNKGNLTEHIPTYATRVVQDQSNYTWSCEIQEDKNNFVWTDANFESNEPLLIYETHVGMSSEEQKINSFVDFANEILPRIRDEGYTTIQLMAIMEHPYYGSFGYQVSSFFAASSRFGYPYELKYLVNKAHSMGIRVLLDLVHSHAVKNTMEGLNLFDGTTEQFFHAGERGEHSAWGTKLFNYAKPQVIHFLLSNLKFWLEEYHFDGFRFDGVTSMLYRNHGLGENFTSLSQYFSLNTDTEAITYLQLANELVHKINPNAITIAEDMSGMPGMTVPIKDGGIGFDYRLAMGQPDLWVNLVKKVSDDNWEMEKIYHQLTFRDSPTVSYVESHDQALVGDKTLFFRMCGPDIYTDMSSASQNLKIDRALALSKLIRLITISAGGTAYLNFMGNEFGHPEWIDFPREGNGYSYLYARRQWSLMDNRNLKYHYLSDFDRDMISLVKEYDLFNEVYPNLKTIHNENKIIAFERQGLVFVFNFHPTASYTGYKIPVYHDGKYEIILSADDEKYGGFSRVEKISYETKCDEKKENYLNLYLPARCAIVLKPKIL